MEIESDLCKKYISLFDKCKMDYVKDLSVIFNNCGMDVEAFDAFMIRAMAAINSIKRKSDKEEDRSHE